MANSLLFLSCVNGCTPFFVKTHLPAVQGGLSGLPKGGQWNTIAVRGPASPGREFSALSGSSGASEAKPDKIDAVLKSVLPPSPDGTTVEPPSSSDLNLPAVTDEDLRSAEAFQPTVSEVFEVDVAKRDDFILSKWNELFPHHARTIKQIHELVSDSEQLGKHYAQWMVEWRLISDRPEYLSEFCDPDTYKQVKETLFHIKRANKAYADVSSDLKAVYDKKRHSADTRYGTVITHLRNKSPEAWVASLGIKDMPISMLDHIRSDIPIPEKSYFDSEGVKRVYDNQTFISEVTKRSSRINNMVRSFKIWLLTTAKKLSKSYFKVWEAVVLNFDFRIGADGRPSIAPDTLLKS